MAQRGAIGVGIGRSVALSVKPSGRMSKTRMSPLVARADAADAPSVRANANASVRSMGPSSLLRSWRTEDPPAPLGIVIPTAGSVRAPVDVECHARHVGREVGRQEQGCTCEVLGHAG